MPDIVLIALIAYVCLAIYQLTGGK